MCCCYLIRLLLRGAERHASIKHLVQYRAQQLGMAQPFIGQIARRLVGHDLHLDLHHRCQCRRQGRFSDFGTGSGQDFRSLGKNSDGISIDQRPFEGAAEIDAQRWRIAAALCHQQSWIAGDHAGEQAGIGYRAPEHANRIERLRQVLDAGPGDAAIAGLEANHTAECRRPDHRSCGLGTERQRHHAVGNCGGRTARRAARRVAGMMRIVGLAGMESGKFRGHRLAQHDATGGAQQRHHGSVGCRLLTGIDWRAVGGRHVDRIEQVLDPDRQAVQQPAHGATVKHACLFQGSVGGEMAPGLDCGFTFFDPGQAGTYHLLGTDLASLQAWYQNAGLECIQGAQGGAHLHHARMIF